MRHIAPGLPGAIGSDSFTTPLDLQPQVYLFSYPIQKYRASNPSRARRFFSSPRFFAPISPTSRKGDTVQVQPYLDFNGRCEEAVEFYRRALGAEVTTLTRFKDSPDPGMCPSGDGNKVMHTSLRIGETTVMASDGRCEGRPSFQGFSLSLAVRGEAEAERLFAALADGGQVQAPLAKTFFSPRFGMVADRFGVSWMIHVAP